MTSKIDRALYRLARAPFAGSNEGCADCAAGKHHAAVRVGSVVICRCLRCPTLTVGAS